MNIRCRAETSAISQTPRCKPAATLLLATLALSFTVGCGASQARKRLPPGQAWDLLPEIPMRGRVDAPVTIIAFKDFQCVFCFKTLPTLQKLMQDYPGQIRVAYVHHPLPFHTMARPAALAAVAAQRQGLFWPMHDALFSRYNKLSAEVIDAAAREVGVDMERFARDVADPAVAAQVDRQSTVADAMLVRGTPTFFINGRRLGGAQPYPVFKKVVDKALAEAKPLQSQGLGKRELVVQSWRKGNNWLGRLLVKYLVDGQEVPMAELVARTTARARKPVWLANQRWNIPVDDAQDAIRGDSSKAQVTIVEFTDLQCPFCVKLNQTLQAVRDKYGDKVRIVFKHLPLNFHKQAWGAHRAAVAAGQQGKFWQMHDACFKAGPAALKLDQLATYAASIGLDKARYDAAMKSTDIDAALRRDMKLAESLGVQGTPTMFINGLRLGGAHPLVNMQRVIEAELKRVGDKVGPAVYSESIKGGRDGAVLGADVTELAGQGVLVLDKGASAVVLTVAADLGDRDGRATLHNAFHAAVAAQTSLRVIPIIGKDPPSTDIGRLLLQASDQGPKAATTFVAHLLRARGISTRPQLAAIAHKSGLSLQGAGAAADKLDPRLRAMAQMVSASTLPGIPAVLHGGRLLQPPRGYEAIPLTRLARQKAPK